MNIYLVRHGETEANFSGIYYGKNEYDLTKRGIEQSKKLSILLKKINFDKIYISEKKRTLKTANEIFQNKYKSQEFIVDSRINEMDLGEFEGKNYKDIEKLYPIHWEKWCSDWKNVSPPGGESYVQFYTRVKSFMQDILKMKAENILIITHSGVIRSIYCWVLNDNIDLFWKFASHNGDLSIIKYEYNNLYIDSIICLDGINVIN
ncbi:alpha-ribazole phosphatase [Clostridium sp. cel8]|jgi:alpha-ribazole phosphatase|uniref:alpha-ribazole phosphatase n=1 Tax=unclassified Clostridium TaxID=2614128 RepID=UPI0015F77B28|nr:alpha-ribazole phosphatase [Clostridium sp. cel8]MBA5851246.1 alpha-ribazole phosphatase [Clostridium sp. cel8]